MLISKKATENKYVLQEHNADKAGLHYDFRITNGEKVYSWAVPKGFPELQEKRLAIEQPEHNLESMSFEGEIPEGYGKGTVKIDKTGNIEILSMEPNKINFKIDDKEYNLIKSKNKNWLIMKKNN